MGQKINQESGQEDKEVKDFVEGLKLNEILKDGEKKIKILRAYYEKTDLELLSINGEQNKQRHFVPVFLSRRRPKKKKKR